jgi:hypothetical protein
MTFSIARSHVMYKVAASTETHVRIERFQITDHQLRVLGDKLFSINHDDQVSTYRTTFKYSIVIGNICKNETSAFTQHALHMHDPLNSKIYIAEAKKNKYKFMTYICKLPTKQGSRCRLLFTFHGCLSYGRRARGYQTSFLKHLAAPTENNRQDDKIIKALHSSQQGCETDTSRIHVCTSLCRHVIIRPFQVQTYQFFNANQNAFSHIQINQANIHHFHTLLAVQIVETLTVYA